MSAFTVPTVNLLSKRKAVFDQRYQSSAMAKVIAGVVLAIYVVLTLFFLGANVYVQQRIETAQTMVDQLKMSLVSQVVVIQQYYSLLTRLDSTRNLMEKRFESVELWKKAQALIPAECEMTQFAIDGNVLKIGVRTPHVLLAEQTISQFETGYTTATGAKKMSATINRSEDANYRIDLELQLLQKSTGKK